MFTVKEVAELAAVSVRTLHHYDAIGLLQPARADHTGYRLYTEADLDQLQQVLFLRELGFSLQDIKMMINRPDFDRKQALLEHKQVLHARYQRLVRLMKTIDDTLDAMERGTSMSKKDMFAGFNPAQYEEEARQRWGHTPAWAESQKRATGYSKEDWNTIRQEGEAIEQGIASLMDRVPTDPEVQAWIQKHHEHINNRYYTCPAEMYRALGNMYVEDERFTAHYEKIRPGMAQFIQAAIGIYCDRLETSQL